MVAEKVCGNRGRVEVGSDSHGSFVTKNFLSLIAGYPWGSNAFFCFVFMHWCVCVV